MSSTTFSTHAHSDHGDQSASAVGYRIVDGQIRTAAFTVDIQADSTTAPTGGHGRPDGEDH